MLIVLVGLGNCGKGAGNGRLEKDLSYSQQEIALHLSLNLSCPSSAVQFNMRWVWLDIRHRLNGIVSEFVMKCKGSYSKSIKTKQWRDEQC